MLLRNPGAFTYGLFSHEGPTEEQLSQVRTKLWLHQRVGLEDDMYGSTVQWQGSEES